MCLQQESRYRPLPVRSSWCLRSELPVEIHLPHVDAQRRMVDFVRRQVAQPQPRAAQQPEVEAELIALRIRAAEVEIGIREGIQHGVPLDIAVAGKRAPVPESGQRRSADRYSGFVALGAFVEQLSGKRLDVG